MRPNIIDIHSPDIKNLEEYWPENETNFCFYLELSIGVASQEGEEIFGITVCTPEWLMSNYKRDEVIFLRHYLLVFEYDRNRIIEAISKRIHSLSADNWEKLALKIGEVAYWEFENYKQ